MLLINAHDHRPVVCDRCGHPEELGHPVRHVARVLMHHKCSAVIDASSIAGDEHCNCPDSCHRH